MPIILRVLSDKNVSGAVDLSRTYIGLWCENFGEGIVEITSEEHFAEIAGFRGERGLRSWRDRVRMLAALGFLRVHELEARKIGFVAVLRPYSAMKRLRSRGLITDGWWAAYSKKLIDAGVESEALAESVQTALETI
jgi:hypothetical protein